MCPWPFVDRGNVPRISLESESIAELDARFHAHQTYGESAVYYLHRIPDDGEGFSVALATWQHFLGLCDAAVAAGDLELVSYEDIEQELAGLGLDDDDVALEAALRRGITGAISASD